MLGLLPQPRGFEGLGGVLLRLQGNAPPCLLVVSEPLAPTVMSTVDGGVREVVIM